MARSRTSSSRNAEREAIEPATAPVVSPSAPPIATPAMAQYLEIKAANPDCLVWYRMGDFYELFFEDAVAASAALGIQLTKRGKHLGEDIPMCGVPVVRADEYLERLIRHGFRVAVCEQLEDPRDARKRGGKAVVRRDVVRLVTPGTITEDTLLAANARSLLAAIAFGGGKRGPAGEVAVAALDISTGELEIAGAAVTDLAAEIARLAPREVLVGDDQALAPEAAAWLKSGGGALTPVPTATFAPELGARLLKAHLGSGDLGAFGDFTPLELAALGALLRYVELTQLGRRPPLRPPVRAGRDGVLVIDAQSRASLEIARSTAGERAGSLIAALDRTVTAAGARELATRISSPLRDPARINARLDAVGFLVERDDLRAGLRAALDRTPDAARAVSRLALQRGGPRDLGAVRDALASAARCAAILSAAAGELGLPAELAQRANALRAVAPGLGQRLTDALADHLPILRRDGGFVRAGYNAELDELRGLAGESRQAIAALEAGYVAETGVRALKIRNNAILGYFIEVSATAARALQEPPHGAAFRHRQTMAGAMRFTTDALAALETRIATAADRAQAIEQEIFASLTAEIAASGRALGEVAAALATLDHEAALAELAAVEGYVRPLVDASATFEIAGGRHPVVEQALRRDGRRFIGNDCRLDAGSVGDDPELGRLWLVTGPNMAGKSTFLRQNALIALMAQMGSFVPAKAAHIGVVDRLFSRVGASDDLARGRSTFMVEMVETAAILNQATDRSLVILDEIGRGTATFDGLSIAWAAVEYLHDVRRCRALFATHFHELTALAGTLPGVRNVTIDVKEWRDEIVFLHKIKPGAADRSYGIQVGKLAGLPPEVIARAEAVLARLEASRSGPSPAQALAELPLFAAASKATAPAAPAASPVEAALADLDPDDLTPRQALDALYRLKSLRTQQE